MSSAERDFRDYLVDILDNAKKLKSFVAGLSFEEFQADEKTQYAVMRAAEVIGEATKRIPQESASAIRKFRGATWQACAIF